MGRAAARRLTRPQIQRNDRIFAALADPTRRELLERLRLGDQPVYELAEAFNVTRPAISQHLRVLREAGLVRETRSGRERRYRLHGTGLHEVAVWIARYEQFWDESLGRLGAVLDRLD
jgi:DNA-binding transcriptional ArsR family regulator